MNIDKIFKSVFSSLNKRGFTNKEILKFITVAMFMIGSALQVHLYYKEHADHSSTLSQLKQGVLHAQER